MTEYFFRSSFCGMSFCIIRCPRHHHIMTWHCIMVRADLHVIGISRVSESGANGQGAAGVFRLHAGCDITGPGGGRNRINRGNGNDGMFAVFGVGNNFSGVLCRSGN